MPFDSTTFRKPSVTVLPPQPPERGGGPQRIHVQIEIVQRAQTPQRRGGRWLAATLIWAIVLALLATLSHAQPSSWQSHQDGFMTRYEGTDRDGRSWTGESYRNGDGTVQFNAYGPDGQTQHCRSYELSGTTHTQCD